jgi:hypothetical protein
MSKATQNKAIKNAIDGFYNKGVSLDDTAMLLTQNGVGFTAIQDTIKSVGINEGWLLTDDKIKEKVLSAVEGKVFSHFLDVVQLAKEIDLAQLSLAEKQKAIVKFAGISKSIASEPSKFKKLHNSGHHGKIADWIKANPDFTPEQLHNSGVCTAPNASEYYDEFLAYREFYRA